MQDFATLSIFHRRSEKLLHGISSNHKSTQHLKNEEHLEWILAKLHLGTQVEEATMAARMTLEQSSFDLRVAKSAEWGQEREEERELVLSEEKQPLWIG